MSYIDKVGEAIDRCLEDPAEQLLRIYFDPGRQFAGATFDELAPNEPNRFSESDLLAVTVLDVRVKPLALRRILEDADNVLSGALRAVPTEASFTDPARVGHAEATALIERLKSNVYPGLGWVMAHKLGARKRPDLIPILDSVITAALGLQVGEMWVGLHGALQLESRIGRLEELRAATPGGTSLIRVLDVAVWMRNSNSKNARSARASVGL